MVIRVLIADDHQGKVEKISGVMRGIFPAEELQIDVATTVTSAAEFLRKTIYDLLVVDMNMPMRSGEEATAEGGLRLITRLQRKGHGLRSPVHIVGLTAFDSLAEEHGAVFSESLWHLIKYSESSDGWALQIAEKLVHIAETKMQQPVDGYDFDLGIVTANDAVELEAVLSLDAEWRTREVAGNETLFHVGSFAGGEDRTGVRVVAAAAGEMGMAAATALSMNMIHAFRPRYLAMVGIAAGYEGSYGDILVATIAWDYGAGKNRYIKGRSTFLPAPSQIQMNPLLKARLSLAAMDKSILRRIQAEWTGEPQPTQELDLRMGRVASGAAVLENRPLVEEIRARDRKLIGIEMEAYGVYMAARVCDEPRPMAMAIKSVCDFADEQKNDHYQAYAAYTSARFLQEFSVLHLAPAAAVGEKTPFSPARQG
jgi:nucleoside phosphorylase/CheY-like chemotaxis protein